MLNWTLPTAVACWILQQEWPSDLSKINRMCSVWVDSDLLPSGLMGITVSGVGDLGCIGGCHVSGCEIIQDSLTSFTYQLHESSKSFTLLPAALRFLTTERVTYGNSIDNPVGHHHEVCCLRVIQQSPGNVRASQLSDVLLAIPLGWMPMGYPYSRWPQDYGSLW